MITLELETVHVEAILKALEIAQAWHKYDREFPRVIKSIKKQLEDRTDGGAND